MHVLIDTNIVPDVLCNREPFVVAASALWTKVEQGVVKAYVVATTITTIFYIVRKQLGGDVARQAVADLLVTFEVLPVDLVVLQAALAKPMPDFEDAIQEAAAELANVPVIVTRNTKDFASSSRRVMDAATLVEELDRGEAGSPPGISEEPVGQ
jgi:predicted nucleic acid-binding protein